MKAKKVKGLDPDATFADAGRLIVSVRVDELYAFIPAALDERQVTALHDMRIAAKRLRYVLELTEFCFGAYAAQARLHARRLHGRLGDVRDCDVLIVRLEQLRPDGDAGMAALLSRWQAMRHDRFGHFVELWAELEQERLRERLVAALDERPTGSHAGI